MIFHDFLIFRRPGAPYLFILLYKNTSKNMRKYMGTSWKHIIFVNMRTKKVRNFMERCVSWIPCFFVNYEYLIFIYKMNIYIYIYIHFIYKNEILIINKKTWYPGHTSFHEISNFFGSHIYKNNMLPRCSHILSHIFWSIFV